MASGSTALLSNESGESDDEFVESNERGSNRLGQNVENGAMQSTEHAMKQFSVSSRVVSPLSPLWGTFVLVCNCLVRV